MSSRVMLKSGLEVFPLCLGGNVFGWTANQEESFKVLDAFVEAGGNFIDTADMYAEWAPGNVGGESETIIGNWMKARGNRHELVIATKVAKLSKRPGLSAKNIDAALEESLNRLQTDHIDIYYAHEDDPTVEMSETLSTFDKHVKSGKIHILGASNFTGARLREAKKASISNNLAQYQVIQNQYNLVDRDVFESDAGIAASELALDSIPYYGIARGFLTGKYQPGKNVESARAQGASTYFTDRGWASLAKVSEIAEKYNSSKAAVALAWLRAKDQTPIASARTVEQLRELIQIIQLTSEEVADLDLASA
ncbi:MAG: aldo/keto reductase [Candidatus Nanopelagicaceae bacterium]